MSRRSLEVCEVLYIRFHLQLCTGLIPTPDQDCLAPLPYRKTLSGGLRVRLDHAERAVIEKAIVPVIIWIHDDAIKWKLFSRYWPFVQGIHRSLGNSPHQGQWRGVLMFSFHLRMNKRLSKQLRRRWFETPSRPLWRHRNVEKWRNS